MQIAYEYQIYMRSSCGCKKKNLQNSFVLHCVMRLTDIAALVYLSLPLPFSLYIIKSCFHIQLLFFTCAHQWCSMKGTAALVHTGHKELVLYAHNENEPRMPPQHEIITTSPQWPPATVLFFLSLPGLIQPSVHNSFLFINLSSCSSVSWDCVSVSCLAASQGMCIMSLWHCTTQHSLGCRPPGQ